MVAVRQQPDPYPFPRGKGNKKEKIRTEFLIWTLTRRIEDDASASTYQGEARSIASRRSFDSADSAQDNTKKMKRELRREQPATTESGS